MKVKIQETSSSQNESIDKACDELERAFNAIPTIAAGFIKAGGWTSSSENGSLPKRFPESNNGFCLVPHSQLCDLIEAIHDYLQAEKKFIEATRRKG